MSSHPDSVPSQAEQAEAFAADLADQFNRPRADQFVHLEYDEAERWFRAATTPALRELGDVLDCADRRQTDEIHRLFRERLSKNGPSLETVTRAANAIRDAYIELAVVEIRQELGGPLACLNSRDGFLLPRGLLGAAQGATA